MNQPDLVIIGAGPGGYVAAERAGEAGLSVILIEENELGGVCLNEGCIPTKALLHSAKTYHKLKSSAEHGIVCPPAAFDLAAAQAWKQKTVGTLVNGIAGLMKKAKVTVVKGRASLDGKTVSVGSDTWTPKNIIIATGSSSFMPPIPGADAAGVLTSRQILTLSAPPKSLAVLGGGVIGMEFASLYAMLGTEVTVLEMLPEIFPFADPDVVGVYKRSLSGITLKTSCKVFSIEKSTVAFEEAGVKADLKAEKILVAAGRRPRIGLEGLGASGIEHSPKGIRVDDRMRTNLPGVYAIGDVTGRSFYAHAASRMAEVAVHDIIGKGKEKMRWHAIPWAVFGQTELAGCGLTETEAKSKGIPVKTAKLPLTASGKYLAENGVGPSVCKTVVHAETGAVLGVFLCGAGVAELIHSASLMIEHELRVADVTGCVYPHPTVSETVRDCLSLIR
jgi:dihydrolipoamide dehydrogenase